MVKKDPSRESHFPAIEKRYGEKMSYWFKVMAKVADKKYPEQMAHLQENYGFSRAHANALVMYSRGSKSSQRYESPAAYFKSIDPIQAKTLKAIFKSIQAKYPKLELVIAWNQPMLRLGSAYIFGAGVAKNHILINPFSKEVLESHLDQLDGYKVNKHTIMIANDWKINNKLLHSLVRARIAETK